MARYAYEFEERSTRQTQYIVAGTLRRAWIILAKDYTRGNVERAKKLWRFIRKVSPTQDPNLFEGGEAYEVVKLMIR